MEFIGAPRTMRSAAIREERFARLGEPHIRPLVDYVAQLRTSSGAEVPMFDPSDGGVNARLLFLMEKPGPMTSAGRRGRAGSGFISRDNDDPTAESTFKFMVEAAIPRQETVLWNVIPGWNGTRRVTAEELGCGIRAINSLLTLLPKVGVIVLVGRKAQRAEPLLRGAGLQVFRSSHPSPIVRASRRAEWDAIPRQWANAYAASL